MPWEAAIAVFVGALIFFGAMIARAPKETDRSHFTIEGRGDFEVEVVGESQYQPALRRTVCGKGYVREQFTAHLVCEDSNKHDSNAVRVDIIGDTVGYLPRASAAAYRRSLKQKGLGNATGVAQAMICGGDKERPSYGVWLDM